MPGVEEMKLAGSQLVKLEDVGFAGWCLARAGAGAVSSAYGHLVRAGDKKFVDWYPGKAQDLEFADWYLKQLKDAALADG